MWLLCIFNSLKENPEVAEETAHFRGESECIARPVNVIGAFYQMCNSMIEYVEY